MGGDDSHHGALVSISGNQACEDCRYYDQVGECHRHAPICQPIEGMVEWVPRWPQVERHEYCGDFEDEDT